MTDSPYRPTPKITAAAIGGAVATLVVGTVAWLGGPEPPPGLEAAIATLAAVAAGYMTRDSSPPPKRA